MKYKVTWFQHGKKQTQVFCTKGAAEHYKQQAEYWHGVYGMRITSIAYSGRNVKV